jgi:E3 ubiquitin-protein ligase DOA10
MNEKSNFDNEKDNNNNNNNILNNKNDGKKEDDVYKEKKELNENQGKYKKKIIMCRICYGDEKDIDSPLIQPCSCSGTMKYIHFACLQKWLKSKVVQKNSIAFSLKQIECELCKSLIPGKYIIF